MTDVRLVPFRARVSAGNDFFRDMNAGRNAESQRRRGNAESFIDSLHERSPGEAWMTDVRLVPFTARVSAGDDLFRDMNEG